MIEVRTMEQKEREPATARMVCTIGYEGRDLNELVRELAARGVQQAIDVRRRAISRKPGFSKSALRSRLEEAGISYVHMPELGTPDDVRRALKKGGSLAAFMKEYGAYLDSRREAFGLFRELVLRRPSAIVCFEKVHVRCHRSLLAERLSIEGLQVEHI